MAGNGTTVPSTSGLVETGLTRGNDSLAKGRRAFIAGAALGLLALTTEVSAQIVIGPSEGVDKTSDGRDYATLSKEEVRALPRAEKDKYYEWRNAQKNAQIIQANAELNESKVKHDAVKLALGIKASEIIPGLLSRAQGGEKLTVSPDLRSVIAMIANGEIPPPEMQENAKKLLTYLV